jgi:hypothetical protein
MKHIHTTSWCDNTSAVLWTAKMNSSKSVIGQQLIRALALCMLSNQSSHLAILSIAGIHNDLADLANQSFKYTGVIKGNYDLSDTHFLTMFNSEFPLAQNLSWIMLRLHDVINSLVFTVLRGKTVPMGSWLRLKKSGFDIGHIGPTLWATYMQLDPFLEGTTEAERIDILAAFARYIRKGHAGRGHQVRSGSVQDALRRRQDLRSGQTTKPPPLPSRGIQALLGTPSFNPRVLQTR